jgi:hypothetical protein
MPTLHVAAVLLASKEQFVGVERIWPVNFITGQRKAAWMTLMGLQ